MGDSIKVPNEDKKTIVLPKELQKEMMEFFLRTSIPRKKRLEQERLSNASDRGDA